MQIYSPSSTTAQLATNGIGNLTCEFANVHEQLNGEFSLTLKVAQNSLHFDDIVLGAIVKAHTPRGYQFFRMSKPVTTLDGGKEVFAWHISYDLAEDMILDSTWTGKTGAEALPSILQSGITERRFTGTSDISLVTSMQTIRTSVLGAIIGEQDNSFINCWGGEIERDNFTVNVKSGLGADKGVTIEYRKNLTGLTIEEDDSELANRIVPTGLDDDDTVVMLPEIYIDSDLIDETPVPHVRHVHFSDVKVGAKDADGDVLYASVDEVRTELRARVDQMYEQGVDLPFSSATIEFVDLSQTEEYKNYAVLEAVEIGDTIKCKYKNIVLTQRIVSYDYDALTEKYNSIVLGSVTSVLGDTLWAQDLDLSALRDDVDGKLTEGGVYNGCYINHTDGYVTVATIEGIEIKTKQNSQDCFAIYADDTYIGGVKVIDGTAVLISGMLTNDEDADCYAVIGEVSVDGSAYRGIFIRDSRLPDDEYALQITTFPSYSGETLIGSLLRLKAYNGTEIRFGAYDMYDFYVKDANGVIRLWSNYLFSEMASPNGNNSIGVDDTGAYKDIGGTFTRL